MTRLFRGAFIVWVVLRYGLDELVLSSFRGRGIRLLTRIVSIGRNLDAPRGERLREALERLGPIFVKFGQVLSTRRDLLPLDIAEELAKLQDRVPPFSSDIAVATIERAFGRSVAEIFVEFDHVPVASASIAQVHFALLQNKEGEVLEVAVKVLRPNMLPAIEKDLTDAEAIMERCAQHCIHLHTRVGHSQGPQVPDPSLPRYTAEVAAQVAQAAGIDAVLASLELPACEDGLLLLKRSLAREKPAKITVNGSLATLAALQRLALLAASSGRMPVTIAPRPVPFFTGWVTPPSQAVFMQKSLSPIMWV